MRAELERRIASRPASLVREDYRPGPAILAAWAAEEPEVCLVGPGGVGKTRGWLERLHRDALARPNSRQVIVRENRTSLTQSVLVTLEQEVFPEGSFGDWESGRAIRFHGGHQQYVYPNGSIIAVTGAYDEERLFGTQWDRVYFGEVNETSLEKYESLWRGLRNKVFPLMQLVSDMNPTYEMHWMHQRCDAGLCREIAVTHADNPTVTEADKDRLRRQYTGERLVRLFLGQRVTSTEASYYGALLHQAKLAGRIGNVAWEPKLPVYTSWDLGIDDATCIWCLQVAGREVRAIDFYEGHNEGLLHYAKWLTGRPYLYKRHFLPHDIEVRELGTGTTRREQLETMLRGYGTIEVVPRVGDLGDRIAAVRDLIPRMWFDNGRRNQDREALGQYEGGFRGLQGLLAYQKRKDARTGEYLPQPLHNWASHVADALGGFALKVHEAVSGGERARGTVKRPAYLQWGR